MDESEKNGVGGIRRKGKRLLWLFGLNVYISAFTFGGGYVVIPMIRKYFVKDKRYFSEEQLLDMAAIAQSSPGAIAVNLSSLAGYRVCGVSGMLASCLGAVLPPLIILSFVTVFYDVFRSSPLIAAALKGMEAGAAALVVDVVADMLLAVLREKKLWLTALAPLTFVLVFLLRISPGFVIAGSALLGTAAGLLVQRRDREEAEVK